MFLLTFTEIARILIIQRTLTHEQQGEDLRKTTNHIIIILNLLVNDLLLSVVLPCIVAVNIFKEIPELRTTASTVSPQTNSPFYTASQRNLVPRRDWQIWPGLQPVKRLSVRSRYRPELAEVQC